MAAVTAALTVPWIDHAPCASDWRSLPWHALVPVPGETPPATAFQIQAGDIALHLRIACTASRLTCRMENDGDPLYLEDVVEVFLRPGEGDPAIYLEYELSPMGREFVLMIASDRSGRSGWRPWAMTDGRRPAARVQVQGGQQRHGATVRGWRADIALPWALFNGLGGKPERGATWTGNIYRIDHADGRPAHAAWSPIDRAAFHQVDRFGSLRF
jgi:hypothetical protein